MSSDQTNSFYESHTIETPEQTDLSFAVAGIGSRFVALLVDTLVQAAVFILVAILVFVFARNGVLAQASRVWVIAGFVALAFLLLYGYFIFFEILWSGQTPGKRTVGIRVIKDSGRRLSPVETIARNLLRIVDQLPGFYGIGILVSLLNKQNKRLGDFVAGSIVIREGNVARAAPPSMQLRASASPLGAERLTEDDLILIESFFQRRYELPPDVRRRMADEIFRRVESKLTVSAEDRPYAERLLEAAVYERRSHLE